MESIMTMLRRVRSRLAIQQFLNLVFFILCWGLSLNLLVLIVDRLFYLGMFVIYVPLGIVVLSVIFSLLYVLSTLPSLFAAAVKADETMRLKERLSSAYLLRGRETPAAEELRKDADAHVDAVVPTRVVIFRLPRTAYYTCVMLLALMVAGSYLPYYDVLQRKAQLTETREEQRAAQTMSEDIRSLSERLKQEMEENKEAQEIEELKTITAELDRLSRDLELDKIDRKQVALKLSTLADKVAERQNLMKSEVKNLQDLSRNPRQKFTRELAQALANADMKGAQQQLRKLAELIQSGKLSEEEKEKLKAEMEQLSKATMKLSPELAKRLAAVAKQLEGRDLLLAAAELDLAEEDLLAIAEAMEQLKMLDSVALDLEARKRACLADIACLGRGNKYTREMIGPGMRGPGIGRGGDAKFDDSATVGFQDTKIAAEKGKGKIISEMFMRGQPLAAPISEEYKEYYVESKQHAEDSLTKEVIPAGYRKFVLDYFDSINPERLPASP